MASTLSLLKAQNKYDHAEQNLLLVLFGFAVSVIATRWFLELTGYPQIASGEFHIAHVLWGGLLLFAAALLLLIWRGHRVQWISSLLTGTGFGLFIDEIGKFITQSNDYFYPLAAPLIYAFFLLTVLIYTRVRGKKMDDEQADVHQVLEILERGLDPDLYAQERNQVLQRLSRIAGQANQLSAARLAGIAKQFLEAETKGSTREGPGFTDRVRTRLQAAGSRWIRPSRFRGLLIAGFLLLGFRGLMAAVVAFLFSMELSHPAGWQRLTTSQWAGGAMIGVPRIVLIICVLIFEAGVGILLLAGAGLMITGRERGGLQFGYWGLLFNLTALYLPILYFEQFEVIAMLLLQFGLMLGVLRYRSSLLGPEASTKLVLDQQS